jgi:hypothetical protein
MQRNGFRNRVKHLGAHLRIWTIVILWGSAVAIPTAWSTSSFLGAPSCSSTSQCTFDTVCQNVGGAKKCAPLSCNDNSGCPPDRPLCYGGKCKAPPNTGTGPGAGLPGDPAPGSSNTLGNVGESCGPYKIGQVTKSRGCKQGLQCVNGKCQMPVQ